MDQDRWHVIPVDDLRVHHESEDCWCKPVVNVDGIVVHNAADGREMLEETEGEA